MSKILNNLRKLPYNYLSPTSSFFLIFILFLFLKLYFNYTILLLYPLSKLSQITLPALLQMHVLILYWLLIIIANIYMCIPKYNPWVHITLLIDMFSGATVWPWTTSLHFFLCCSGILEEKPVAWPNPRAAPASISIHWKVSLALVRLNEMKPLV